MKNIIRQKSATHKAMCSACFPRSVKSSLFYCESVSVFPVSGAGSFLLKGKNIMKEEYILDGLPEMTRTEEKRRMRVTKAVRSILKVRPDWKEYKFFRTEYRQVVFPVVDKNKKLVQEITVELNEKLKISESETYRIGIDDEKKIVFYLLDDKKKK